MSKVFITDYIDDPTIEKEILGDNLAMSFDSAAEVILVWHQNINKAYIDSLPNLKGIVRYGVGFDSIDIAYASTNNIVTCNTPDYGTEEVSDTAFAMIMDIVRGIHRYDFLCRNYRENWQENTLKKIKRTSSHCLGVIGAGRIGSSVLNKAKALRFNTVFYDPFVARGYEKVLGAERVDSLDELLEVADIVSLHCPLTDDTRGMVNHRFLDKMKPGASLVNTARGGLISDLEVFFEPLKRGQLYSLYSDVLPEEPPQSSCLIDAWRAREEWLDGRLVINPHTAYYSQQAYVEMREKAACNALRIIEGKNPFNVVN